MNLIFHAALLVCLQVQTVFLEQGIEWHSDPRNCYDQDGNATPCEPPAPDYGEPCVPQEPDGSLGPDMRPYYYESNDCYTDTSCKRRYHVAWEKVETMFEARSRCYGMNMRLVSIENRKKWFDILDAIHRSGQSPTFYYTSARKDAKTHRFSWGTGCAFSFTNWGYQAGKLQPDNYKKEEDCMEIVKDLTWNDYPCKGGKRWWRDYMKSYICESLTCVF